MEEDVRVVAVRELFDGACEPAVLLRSSAVGLADDFGEHLERGEAVENRRLGEFAWAEDESAFKVQITDVARGSLFAS